MGRIKVPGLMAFLVRKDFTHSEKKTACGSIITAKPLLLAGGTMKTVKKLVCGNILMTKEISLIGMTTLRDI